MDTNKKRDFVISYRIRFLIIKIKNYMKNIVNIPYDLNTVLILTTVNYSTNDGRCFKKFFELTFFDVFSYLLLLS